MKMPLRVQMCVAGIWKTTYTTECLRDAAYEASCWVESAIPESCLRILDATDKPL